MIPKEFELAGRTWTVKRRVKHKRLYGWCDPGDAVIVLTTKCKTHQMEEQTFYHELAHAFGFAMAWKALINNEDKVDALGSLLLQVIKTAKA